MSEDDSMTPPDKLDAIMAMLQKADARLDKADARDAAFEERFDATDERFEAVEKTQRDMFDRMEQLATQQRQTMSTSGAIERSANAAFELANRALKESDAAKDETRKMVESAMAINKTTIAETVGEVVKPITSDIEALKGNDTSQNTTLAAQNAGIVLIAREMGVEEGLDPKLLESAPPQSNEDRRRLRGFSAMDRRLKSSTLVQIVIALAAIAAALKEVLGH